MSEKRETLTRSLIGKGVPTGNGNQLLAFPAAVKNLLNVRIATIFVSVAVILEILLSLL